MSAVELPDRDQIQRGEQQSDPTGNSHRMQIDVLSLGQRLDQHMRELREEDRRAEDGASLDGMRAHQPQHAKDQRRHQPGQWAGDANVEQCLAVADPSVHADNRAQRAQRPDRHGDEVGEAGWHAVTSGLNEVARLVANQNRHHGQRVGQPAEDERGHVVPLRCPTRHERGDAGQQEHHQRQQHPSLAWSGAIIVARRRLGHQLGNDDIIRQTRIRLVHSPLIIGDWTLVISPQSICLIPSAKGEHSVCLAGRLAR